MAIEDLPDEYLDTVLEDGLTIREHMEISFKKALEYKKNSPNPKFHRTDEEEEKLFIFQQKYADKISFFENKIYSNHIYKINNKFDIIMSLIKCNRAISYYNKFKEFCYKNDGEVYFQDMWERCHNSQQACFPYISQIEETKRELMDILKNKK